MITHCGLRFFSLSGKVAVICDDCKPSFQFSAPLRLCGDTVGTPLRRKECKVNDMAMNFHFAPFACILCDLCVIKNEKGHRWFTQRSRRSAKDAKENILIPPRLGVFAVILPVHR
jgi:hypothetical protein